MLFLEMCVYILVCVCMLEILLDSSRNILHSSIFSSSGNENVSQSGVFVTLTRKVGKMTDIVQAVVAYDHISPFCRSWHGN